MKAAIIICALVGWTSAAGAATEREKKKAKVHAKNAAELFEAQSYDLALVEFKKAYELFPVPGLLFNMGQCHLFLGEYAKAIDRFETFLSQKPDTPYRADVERLIGEAQREMEKQRAEQEAARVPPPPPPPVEPPLGPDALVSRSSGSYPKVWVVSVSMPPTTFEARRSAICCSE